MQSAMMEVCILVNTVRTTFVSEDFNFKQSFSHFNISSLDNFFFFYYYFRNKVKQYV